MKALKKNCHPKPKKPQHSPHRRVKIKYGPEGQLVPKQDSSPKVPKETIEYIQAAMGIFLWYGRIVNLTLLPALNAISLQQATPTKETVKELDHFLDHIATYPNAAVRFHASNMILDIHSGAAYMVFPKARSRAGGYFYLSSKPNKTNSNEITLNGSIHNECSTICNVMGLAVEAEVGGLYINCQRGEEFRTTLHDSRIWTDTYVENITSRYHHGMDHTT
eukprot:157902-Ditylum_brightwellii.AAC.1